MCISMILIMEPPWRKSFLSIACIIVIVFFLFLFLPSTLLSFSLANCFVVCVHHDGLCPTSCDHFQYVGGTLIRFPAPRSLPKPKPKPKPKPASQNVPQGQAVVAFLLFNFMLCVYMPICMSLLSVNCKCVSGCACV